MTRALPIRRGIHPRRAFRPRQRGVITSYSIHYTKLYEWAVFCMTGWMFSLLVAAAFPRTGIGLKRLSTARETRTVITSYSIHYTKLYEARKNSALRVTGRSAGLLV